MNYNQKVQEKVFKKYITHGINENVKVTNIEKVSGDKEGTVWKAFDITFSNGESELKTRIFQFKYRPGATDFKGNILDEATQESDYLKRIKHLFSKVVGDSDKYDEYISKVAGTTDAEQFDSLTDVLESIVKSDTKPFRLLCIDNKKGYPKVPDWNSGFAESMEVNPTKLTFNEAKYGKPKLPEATEVISSSPQGLTF